MTDENGQNASRPVTRPAARGTALAAAVLIAAGVVVYANSFSGTFVYDDYCNIVTYPHRFWPGSLVAFIRKPLWRSITELNYELFGLDPTSYHAVNLMVHLLAGLTLFAIARRTMLSKRLSGLLGRHSTLLAAAIGLLWLVHPLQTESVTYIVQRRESMMGLFYLLTLYCLSRGVSSERGWVWYAAAVFACAIGMNIKPVMVTAPIICLLYDRIFLSRSLRELLKRRWPVYVGLAATWLILLKHGGRMRAQGMGIPQMQMSQWDYLLSQFGVISHYLRLSFWPDVLVLDYAWPVARRASQIVPYAILIAALGLATLVCLLRRPAWGFLGAWFFGILAPTSSIITIDYLAFEHRMYLSLAGVAAAVVIASYLLGRRIAPPAGPRARLAVGICALAVAATALGARTVMRNRDYHSRERMWRSVIRYRPGNYRAYNNLGVALAEQGRDHEAAECYATAIRLWPGYGDAHANLAAVFYRRSMFPQAARHYQEAIRIDPTVPQYHLGLGKALAACGKQAEAMQQFLEALRLDPSCAAAWFQLALTQRAQGDDAAAAGSYRKALAIRPDWPAALNNLAWLLARSEVRQVRNAPEAVRLSLRACELTRWENPRMILTLAVAYESCGRKDEFHRTLGRAREVAVQKGQADLAEQISRYILDADQRSEPPARPSAFAR